MKTSSTWNDRSIVGKIMIGIVLVAMIGSLDVAPALGREQRTRNYDDGRYEHRGRGYDRGRYVHDRYVPRPNGYRGRVYVPPRIYAPPPPPGIAIFFPPIYLPFGPGPRHR